VPAVDQASLAEEGSESIRDLKKSKPVALWSPKKCHYYPYRYPKERLRVL